VTTVTHSHNLSQGPPIDDIPPGGLFIAGEWEPAASGAVRELINPATGQVLTGVAEAGLPDVERATRAARRAFDEGSWASRSPRDRGRVLLRAAELLRERADEFAELESLNVGKPITFSRTVDIPMAVDVFEYYGCLTAGIEGAARSTSLNLPTLAYTRREPIGVVAAITPMNFPLLLSATKIAPALAAGNTVVHKPAEETPLTALRMAEVLQDAGVPDGVFNVITGDADTGEFLVRDPWVDKVAFTGSTGAGQRVAAACASTLKHLTLQLGGKGANIVFADADFDAAISTAIGAFVVNTGQFCLSGARLLVERPIYADFVDALAEACPRIPVGDPFDPATMVGPMAGPRHLARVQSYLDLAADDSGVRILGNGGDLPSTGGFFIRPTVLDGVDQASPFVQEEIFGPVLTVQPFDTEADAVRLASDVPYGLAAGLQTRDLTRAHQMAGALAAGIVWVNGWAMIDALMPFGGYKQSGYGRENGPDGLEEYLRTKSVVVALR
jgi:acyl-CoA reductase-like NAD-dependent aldehyde dehydrogenase